MKNLTHIIIFSVCLQLSLRQEMAYASIDAQKILTTKKCGDFKLVSESIDEAHTIDFASFACRTDDGVLDKKHKTPGARTQIHVKNEVIETSKNISQIIDRTFLDLIRQKVKSRFDAKLITIDTSKDKTFHEAYLSMQKKILDDGKAPKHQIRKLLILFPDVEDEILKNNPDYKALICRHEVWKKNQKILRSIALGLTVVELAALLGAAPIAATIILTANIDRALLLSQILIVGGVAGILAGALQIENNISNWDQVTAAKNAKMLLKFYKNIEGEIKKLQKNPNDNKEKIFELQKWLPTTVEMQQLEQTKKKKFKQYKDLFFGLSKVGIGVTLIFGGDQLFKMISQFQKDSPAGSPTSGSISPPWMN